MAVVESEPVGARVRVARRWLGAARLAESVILGAAAFLLILAVTCLSAPESLTLPAFALASGCALATALAHGLAHRESAEDVARRLDSSLFLHGALFTAYEVERDPRAPQIARRLSSRVAARVSGLAARRTLLPRSTPLIALPFIAGTLLALSIDHQQERDPRRELERHGARLHSGSGSLRQAMRSGMHELEADEREQLEELARLAGSFERRARGELDPEEARAQLEELRRRAEELAAKLPPENPARRELAELSADADAAARSIGGERAPDAAAARRAEDATLTPEPADGTMSDRPALDELPTGLPGRRPWPAENARIVERWIETRRLADPPPHPDR